MSVNALKKTKLQDFILQKPADQQSFSPPWLLLASKYSCFDTFESEHLDSNKCIHSSRIIELGSASRET
jgi:hypothetical protein